MTYHSNITYLAVNTYHIENVFVNDAINEGIQNIEEHSFSINKK